MDRPTTSIPSAELTHGPPRYDARSPWGVFMALAATALVALVPAIMAFVGVSFWAAYATHSGLPGGDEADRLDAFSSLATPEGVGLVMATQLASLALVWGFASWRGARASVLQLKGERLSWRTYVMGALGLIVLTGALEFLLYTVFKFDIFADTAWLAEGLRSPLAWATVLIAVVLAPLWEELTFRGFLLAALAQTRLGFWGGALISNSLWTVMHGGYSWPGMVSVFVAGLVLSWLVWRTGSLKPAIFAHAAGNMAAVTFSYAFAPLPG